MIVGDRPDGHARGAAASWPAQGVDLIITSGGLGPTADDLTARGRRRVPGARDGARRARSRSGSPRSCAPLMVALAEPRPGGDPRRPTASRRVSRAARRCSSRSGPRPGSSCRRRTGATGRRSSCCPGRRASCSRCGRRRVEDRRVRGGGRRRDRRTSSEIAAPVRDARVRDRRDAARGRGRRASSSTRSRSRPACGAARSRSSTRYEPPRADVYDALRGRRPRAPRRHAVLRRRRARSTSRSPALLRARRLDDRRRRVVHRRAAGGAADRAAPGSSAYVLGGDRRVLQRGEGRRWRASSRR